MVHRKPAHSEYPHSVARKALHENASTRTRAASLSPFDSDAGASRDRRTGRASSEEKMVEAAGIEPASESTPLCGSYMLVPRFVVIRRNEHGPPARRTISE
jgi:hypothetical protein